MNEKLIKLRKESGLSQNQIADYLDIDQSYISKMEKGERPITLDIAEKLAILNGYDLSYFLSDNINEPLNISFRSSSLNASDFKAIAKINEIALNLKWMRDLGRINDDK